MQDSPTVDQLLEAVTGFLQQEVMPNTTGRLSYLARVSANVVEMLRRELSTEEGHLAEEWDGLNRLLGEEARPDTLTAWRSRTRERNVELAARIQNGDADSGEFGSTVFAHLRGVIQRRLEVSDPRLATSGAQNQ